MKRENSDRLFSEASKILVGGVNSPVRSFKGVGGSPLFIKQGKGCKVYCEDGNEYIDFVLSWGPLLFGHANKQVLDAVQKTMANGTSFGAPCSLEIDLAKLIQHFFPGCEKVRLVNSGTESVMTAIRLARGYTGRKKILKFNGCYHGHLDSLLVQSGSGALTLGRPDSAGVLEETARETVLCEFNDIEGVKIAFQENQGDIAALILEPVAGNMGVVLPEENFLEELRKICTENGTLLIFDEVMTGFRMSPGGIQAVKKISPDLTCLAKIMGGGLPCAAFGGSAKIMDHLAPLGPVYQAGTLSGNPVAVQAGITMLSILKNNPEKYLHAEQMTTKLSEGIKDIIRKHSLGYQVNSFGTMFTIFFTQDPVKNLKDAKKSDTAKFGRFFHALLKKGIYFAPSQFEANFLSSEHKEEDIDKTLNALEAILPTL